MQYMWPNRSVSERKTPYFVNAGSEIQKTNDSRADSKGKRLFVNTDSWEHMRKQVLCLGLEKYVRSRVTLELSSRSTASYQAPLYAETQQLHAIIFHRDVKCSVYVGQPHKCVTPKTECISMLLQQCTACHRALVLIACDLSHKRSEVCGCSPALAADEVGTESTCLLHQLFASFMSQNLVEQSYEVPPISPSPSHDRDSPCVILTSTHLMV